MSEQIRTIDLGGEQGLRLSRRRAADVAVLTAAVLLALLAIVPAYGVEAALPTLVAGALLGATIVVVARVRALGGLVVVGLTAAAYLLAGGAFAAPTTTVARVVPTLTTLRTLAEGLVTSWKEVLTLQPPLGTLGAVLVPPFVLALVGTVLAGWAGTHGGATWTGWQRVDGDRRAPARVVETVAVLVAAVVPPALLVVAILLGTVEAPVATLVGAGLAALLVPWVAWRTHRWHPRRVVTLAVMAVVALTAGVVGGPVVAGDAPRTVLRNVIVPPFDLRDQVSPLAGFRSFVKDARETELFTVAGLPEGALVRLATMDTFDGVVWNVDGTGALGGSGAFRRVGEAIPTTVAGTPARVSVEVSGLRGVWLPTVGQTTSLEFSGRRSTQQQLGFRFNDATGAAVLPDGLREGDRWVADVVVPTVPDDETLADAEIADVRQAEPEGMPDAAVQKAASVAASATSPALLARALEAALSEQGYFSHGIVAAGDHPSLSGHGASRIEELFTDDRMIGDDEQYASAMALMARNLGLPARVVLGFRPDAAADPAEPVVVTGDDVVAWVEIAYQGYGWVPYFPTPDVSRTPSENPEEAEPDPQPEVVQPPPALDDPVVVPDEDLENVDVDAREDVEEEESGWGRVVLLTAAIGIPVLLLVLPPFLVLAAKARRRRRRRRAKDPMARVTGAWDEVLDAVRDRDEEPARTATRTEAARSIEAVFPAVGVRAVARGVDAAVFGPGEPDDAAATATWQGAEEVLAGLGRSGTRFQRLRGRLSTRSLAAARARRRAERAARRGARRGKVRRAARR